MRTTVTIDADNRELNELLDRVVTESAEFIIERDGKAVAVLTAPSTLLEMVKKLHEGNMDIPPEEIEREIERAVREVREARRGERP